LRWAAERRSPENSATQIMNECALLWAMTGSELDEAMFVMRTFGLLKNRDTKFAELTRILDEAYNSLFEAEFGFDCQKTVMEVGGDKLSIFHVHGCCVDVIIGAEHGSHLYCSDDGSLRLIQTVAISGAESFQKLVAVTSAVDVDDRLTPAELPQVVDARASFRVLRMHDYRHRTIDFRTGQVGFERLTGRRLRELIVGGLPLPGEFSEF
jgi:hypothetical protein